MVLLGGVVSTFFMALGGVVLAGGPGWGWWITVASVGLLVLDPGVVAALPPGYSSWLSSWWGVPGPAVCRVAWESGVPGWVSSA